MYDLILRGRTIPSDSIPIIQHRSQRNTWEGDGSIVWYAMILSVLPGLRLDRLTAPATRSSSIQQAGRRTDVFPRPLGTLSGHH
jgi:hypothetical protein